jgi:ATP-dependent DNA helicase RecG
MDLEDKVVEVNGIGPKYARLLESLGIHTVEDMLLHIPFRYDDTSNINKISSLVANIPATVIGTVKSIDNIYTKNGKRITKAVIEDESGKLNLIWFNQHYIKRSVPVGSTLSVFGTLDEKERIPQFISPEWEIVKNGLLLHTGGIIPVYPVSEGITTKWFRTKIKYILENIVIENKLPETIIAENNFCERADAFKYLHSPYELEEVDIGKSLLRFEELFFLHLKGLALQSQWQRQKNSHVINIDKEALNKFTSLLDFKLTLAQKRSIDEILEDLKCSFPMNRLLQGDVGSGKTVVAATTILAAAESGFNTILLSPTQMLAEQHFNTLKVLLKEFDIEIHLLTGTNTKVNLINDQKPYLIISTHAILYHLDMFSNIGLIVIDEQHKFGVEQRTKITDYYSTEKVPNLLTMTATPIPRSMALTLYGDLKLSIIDELPISRIPVITRLTTEDKRNIVYKWIKEQITNLSTQVFIVCPFIEQSTNETFKNVKAAEVEFNNITKYFQGVKVGLLHGRLSKEEKEIIINGFRNNDLSILVTTPVIEVGIDIPNANIILIETPERFGLASLHQLRGRVGRGKEQGYCILISSTDSVNIKRLKYMEKISNGNKLAEIDLKLRGPGNLYGTEQHGYLDLKVADITDIDLIIKTKGYAQKIFNDIIKYPKIAFIIEQYKKIGKN